MSFAFHNFCVRESTECIAILKLRLLLFVCFFFFCKLDVFPYMGISIQIKILYAAYFITNIFQTLENITQYVGVTKVVVLALGTNITAKGNEDIFPLNKYVTLALSQYYYILHFTK